MLSIEQLVVYSFNNHNRIQEGRWAGSLGMKCGGRFQDEIPNPRWEWTQEQESALVLEELGSGWNFKAGVQLRNLGWTWGSGRRLGCRNRSQS